MPDYIIRMEDELNGLDERIRKAEGYVRKKNGELTDAAPSFYGTLSMALLTQQVTAMAQYRSVLMQRIILEKAHALQEKDNVH